jgi:hypothetical protein
LKNYYSYSVEFRAWDSFAVDIGRDDPAFSSDQINSSICSSGIVQSFAQAVTPGENQELTLLGSALHDLLENFGFRLAVHSPPKRDLDFTNVARSQVILSGEGERSTKLPDTELPENASHQLCSFGFATVVAKTNPQANDDAADGLATLLQLDTEFLKRHGRKPRQSRASPLVESLLTAQGYIQQVADFVSACRIAPPTVRAMDAVNLWAAVMQACGCAVTSNRKLSIVLSGKMVWFVRLIVKNGACFVEITNGRRVDGKGFLMDIVRLLQYAENNANGAMNIQDKDEWDSALEGIDEDESTKDDEGSGQERKRARDSTDSEESNPSSDAGSTVASGSTPQAQDGNVSSHTRTVSAFKLQRKNKYGVIPRFSQIGESLGLLGVGRCGKVKKVAWGSSYAALKEFSLRVTDEEPRYFFDVYEKELRVLLSLEKLWGTHVPALLFHKPWTTCLLIGLQLGEPIMEDYIALLSKEDQEFGCGNNQCSEGPWMGADGSSRKKLCPVERPREKEIYCNDRL